MQKLEPKFTKLRAYIEGNYPGLRDNVQSKFPNRFMESCETFKSDSGKTILEIIALRVSIHQRIVPMIEELFPNSFVTMEAVCGFQTRSEAKHKHYEK